MRLKKGIGCRLATYKGIRAVGWQPIGGVGGSKRA